jgi:AcrR family transcriptional regulator
MRSEVFIPAMEHHRRNSNFVETHRELVEKAVALVSLKGLEALSVAALAHAANINRSTVYYHFDSRESLLLAVRKWVRQQVARGLIAALDNHNAAESVTQFLLENNEVAQIWIDDFAASTNMRESYPEWDAMVEAVQTRMGRLFPGAPCDGEIWCLMLLSAWFVAPRIARQALPSVRCPNLLAARFKAERLRLFALAAKPVPES